MFDGMSTAFERYFEENQAKVYRLALGLTGNAADAEEIAQESFLRAFRSFHSFRGESSFFTWIYRITINTASDYMKKASKFQIHGEDLGCAMEGVSDTDPANDPEALLHSDEIRQRCLHCFTECLPAKQRTAFCLAVTLGLPYKAAADIMDCSLVSFKTTVHRAKKRLSGFMGDRCQLISASNPCRCDQWVRFARSRGRELKEYPASPPAREIARIRDDINILLKIKIIYRNLYPESACESLAQRIKQGIKNKEWQIFS